ncbi:hypothetical protein B0H14DRAFT_3727809 [Mycena olivaceomarginata]|nr:hypothetical protein B0H14DRAFT_3727809 [Mycena olivaceomarginata]
MVFHQTHEHSLLKRSNEVTKMVASDLVVEKDYRKGGYLVADESQNGDALSEAEDATSLDSEDGGRSTASSRKKILLAIFRSSMTSAAHLEAAMVEGASGVGLFVRRLEIGNSVLVHLEISDGVPYTEVFPALAQLAPTFGVTLDHWSSGSHLHLHASSHNGFSTADLSVADTLPPSAPWVLPATTQLLIRPRSDFHLRLTLPSTTNITRAFLEEYGRTVQGAQRPRAVSGLETAFCGGVPAVIELGIDREGTAVPRGLRSVDVFGPSPAFDSGCLNLKTAFPALCAYRYIFETRAVTISSPTCRRVSTVIMMKTRRFSIRIIFSARRSPTLFPARRVWSIYSRMRVRDKDDEDDVDYVFDEAEEDSEEEDLDVDLDCSIANDPLRWSRKVVIILFGSVWKPWETSKNARPLSQFPGRGRGSRDPKAIQIFGQLARRSDCATSSRASCRQMECHGPKKPSSGLGLAEQARIVEAVQIYHTWGYLWTMVIVQSTRRSALLFCRGEKQRNSPHTISKKAYWGHGPSKAQNRDF